MRPTLKFRVLAFPLIETGQTCLISLNEFLLLDINAGRKSSLPPDQRVGLLNSSKCYFHRKLDLQYLFYHLKSVLIPNITAQPGQRAINCEFSSSRLMSSCWKLLGGCTCVVLLLCQIRLKLHSIK